MWDARGKIEGVPLHLLLGGAVRTEIPHTEYFSYRFPGSRDPGEASPVEVVRAVIDHIGRWEPHLKATYAFDPERALTQARESEARWRKGEPLDAIDGVPLTLKENIATKGLPMPLGTAATELVPMADDAPPAARLREAGAVLLAKTTMPDYGMLSSGLSSFHPLTRNPWDLAKNPGGSAFARYRVALSYTFGGITEPPAHHHSVGKRGLRW